MKINHNIAALNAYRNLAVNNSTTAKSLEKLSSGLRINRASDDAAGLAISEKMRSQIRGLDMAERNALDGVSFVQTAEGALSSVHSMLQRMRELAVQAANDSNTKVDRGAIQQEINELTNEINRISNATEFNTKKLLDGSLELGEVTTKTAGVQGVTAVTAVPGQYEITLGTSDITVNGKTFYYSATAATAGKWNSSTELAGLIAGDGVLSAKYAASNAGGKLKLVQQGTKESSTAPIVSGGPLATMVEGVEKVTAVTQVAGIYEVGIETQDMIIDGITLTYDKTGAEMKDAATLKDMIDDDLMLSGKYKTAVLANGRIQLTQQAGRESANAPVVGNSVALQIGANQGQTVMLELKNMQAEAIGISSTTLSGEQTITLLNGEELKVWYTEELQSNNGVNNELTDYTLDVSTHEKASAAITVFNDAIERVSEERSRLGAVQNRLEHTVDNLKYMSENTTAAEARIRDLDMALEMTAYTKNNILVQSAQAMLAQANQLPQGVLQLLQ